MPSFNHRWASVFGCLGVLLCLLTSARPALADSPQQTQQALLKAQGLLKQIAQQKSLAEAELAKLRGELAGKEKALTTKEHEIEAQKKILAQAEAGVSAAGQRNASLTNNLERTKVRLEKTTAKLHEVAGMYKETRAKLQATDAARQTFEAQLAATTKELQDADQKNLALDQANQEPSSADSYLLRRFQHNSFSCG